jgi:uncharacterized protein YeaO (DUF488 family)
VAIRTKRWNDPRGDDDGFRLLVCRYRPRGVSKARETWDEWWPELGPSRELHAAYWGKGGARALGWPEYRRRYLEEMEQQGLRLRALAARDAAGETITLLCSSACLDPACCHRTVLADLVTSLRARRRAPRPGATSR